MTRRATGPMTAAGQGRVVAERAQARAEREPAGELVGPGLMSSWTTGRDALRGARRG